MKVFATGHRGYIGAHLVDVLKQEGHTVIGCDLGLFEGCHWEPLVAPDRELIKDIRQVDARDGMDATASCAAAISNDPMGG
jgi:nucleoside-diphosphate-sugar epimerase